MYNTIPFVAITKLIIKIPNMIVKTIAGLYCLMDGYSSTIDAPNVSMHPITVETDTKKAKIIKVEISSFFTISLNNQFPILGSPVI